MGIDDALREVDAIFDRAAAMGTIPGMSYGVVIGGDLVHARGLGTLRDGEERVPDADSVFRIASMTKSFTASVAVLLRDEGVLRFDEPVATYVPELATLRGPTADSPPVTVQHLLTMAGGLPTDDPWGDRLQGMDLERFAGLLSGGFEAAWAPGTIFEYSNLGYGMLGRVLTNVGGTEYRDLVRARLLDPLGMGATVYTAGQVPPDRVAVGYVRRDDSFVEEPFDGYGALASMGGIFSSVRDLATWVVGFADAFPPRDQAEGSHPLSRASRREMQQVHRSFEPELRRTSTDSRPELISGGYGLGLFVSHDLRLGHLVGHSGGYPGFGSHMRWHPGSGVGVVALGNRTYAPMSTYAAEALTALVTRESAPIRSVIPWEATRTARAQMEGLLRSWDLDLATEVFASNVHLDDPLDRRRTEIERIRERHGALSPDPDLPEESDSPAHQVWWLRGARGGRVRVEILMTGERPPRVQSFALRSVMDPSPAMAEAIRRVAVLSGLPAPEWPDELPLAGEFDREAVDRSLRAASALFGPLEAGPAIRGDGVIDVTVELRGDRGTVDLRLVLDPETGAFATVSLVPRTISAPRA
ncbi:MAG: serine hydrolase domain-containing protein [Actinomycetota bacterium]